MSINKAREIILARQVDLTNQPRYVQVYENSNEQLYTNINVKSGSTTKTINYYPHTYTKFEIFHKYLTNPFNYVDIVITNRFTMESIELRELKLRDNNANVESNEIINDTTASSIIRQVYTNQKENVIVLILSMADFMYGDVYMQFYDETTEAGKNTYDAPIIFQFTNAPTVFNGHVYKWRPNLAENTSALYDYDNVFNDAFGAIGPPPQKQADLGRADVLTGNASESAKFYYNDFMSADRLITNGYKNPDTSLNPSRSLSGHPVYIIEYVSVVPSAFSSAFGKNQEPVTFVPLNNEEHAYLTSSVDNITAMYADAKSLTMTSRDDVYFPYSAVSVYSASTDANATKMTCSVRKYIAHLTANSADRPDDKWFREHTRVCADFVLSGIDPYWMSDDKV